MEINLGSMVIKDVDQLNAIIQSLKFDLIKRKDDIYVNKGQLKKNLEVIKTTLSDKKQVAGFEFALLFIDSIEF